MKWLRSLILVTGVFSVVLSHEEDPQDFDNQWAVEIPGGEKMAQRVARENGFKYVEKVSRRVLLVLSIRSRSVIFGFFFSRNSVQVVTSYPLNERISQPFNP